MRLPNHPGTNRRPRPISLSRRGVARRLARRAAAAALLAGALATLTACGGALVNGYYLLPAARTSYLFEEFEWWDDGLWNFDAEEGYAWALDVSGGYFIAADARQFARTWDPIPTTLDVRAAWEVWSPDATPIRDNNDEFDFRIVFDTSDSGGYVPSGVRVELKLFDGGIEDRLTITDDASGSTVSVANPTVAPTRGTIAATFRRNVDSPTVRAAVYDRMGDVLLEADLQLDEQWGHDTHLLVEASGFYDGVVTEARAIDSVHALRPEGL